MRRIVFSLFFFRQRLTELFLFLFNLIETNVLRASPTSEFSHSLGQKRKWPGTGLMSVLPSTADIVRPLRHVRFVPKAEVTSTLSGFARKR
jgi:hypothetical protein